MKNLLKTVFIFIFIVLTYHITITALLQPKAAQAQWTKECTAVPAPGGPGGAMKCDVTVQCPAGKDPVAILITENPPVCDCFCKPGTGSPSVSPTVQPSISPPKAGGPGTTGSCAVSPEEWFGDGECSLKTWAALSIKYMIAIGFVYAVIMTPYIFYLFASGDPGKIKRGWDLVRSIVYGLILLVLTVTVVTLVGGSVLQI